MIRLTLSFTDLIEVSSLTEKFQHFSAAVARIYAIRVISLYWYILSDIELQNQKSDLVCEKKIDFDFWIM